MSIWPYNNWFNSSIYYLSFPRIVKIILVFFDSISLRPSPYILPFIIYLLHNIIITYKCYLCYSCYLWPEILKQVLKYCNCKNQLFKESTLLLLFNKNKIKVKHLKRRISYKNTTWVAWPILKSVNKTGILMLHKIIKLWKI